MNDLGTENECRTCLKTTGPFHSIFMLNDISGQLSSFSEMIMSSSASVYIAKKDGLSDLICLQCARKILEFYEFKLKIEMNDFILRSRLTNLNVKVEDVSTEDFHNVIHEDVNQYSLKEDLTAIKQERLNNDPLKIEEVDLKDLQKETLGIENFEIKPENKSNEVKSPQGNSIDFETCKIEVKEEEEKDPLRFDEIKVKSLCEEQETFNINRIITRGNNNESNGHKRKIQCPHCHKKYSQTDKLEKGFLVDTGEEYFECEYCNKSFNLKKKRQVFTIPADEVRYDQTAHWPQYTEKKGRCKYCPKGYTQLLCLKCNLNLCLTVNKNCYYKFHNKA